MPDLRRRRLSLRGGVGSPKRSHHAAAAEPQQQAVLSGDDDPVCGNPATAPLHDLTEEVRMPVRLNHTIVYCRDKQASASFLSEILGLPAPTSFGPFSVVQVANDVSLDFLEEGTVHPQHYAFLVDEIEFDQIHGRILARGIPYWADPERRRPQQMNTNDGGRGLYWLDPDSHILEILTVPYGGWPNQARP